MNSKSQTTSVALCTYNGEQYLREQLNSILHQTILPDEIIICDDGSADRTIEIVTSFKKIAKFDVKLFFNEYNLGSTKNFEKAIGLCSGDIIFLCDQDDVWAKDKIEKICLCFNENSFLNVVFTNAFFIENGVLTINTLWKEISFPKVGRDKLLRYLLIKGNVATGATLALKKECINHFLPFIYSPYWLHDGQLVLQASVTNSAGYLPECLTLYRRHDNQKVGVSKFLPSPMYQRIIRMLKEKTWLKRETYFIEEANLLQLLQKHFNDKYPQNISWINNSEFFRRQLERALKSNYLLKGFILFKLLLSGKYKYVSFSKRRRFILFIKDFIGTK